ncbi:MAG TPA: hypothetical protein VGB37_02900 [Candidatus Lokiarchaeia archaeon]
MNKEIQNIYILDSTGKPIFISENYVQGTGEIDHGLLSNFITAIQSFASELGEKEVMVIELGNGTIYSVKDNKYQIQFVLKCQKEANAKKMFKILTDIKDLFFEKFSSYIEIGVGDRGKIISSFVNDLHKMLGASKSSELL